MADRRGLVLWDWHGTLSDRSGRVWGSSLAEALDEVAPGHGIDPDDLSRHLQHGFPWHHPDRPHPELSEPDAWWASVQPVLAQAAVRLGVSADVAAEAAQRERHHLIREWSLLDGAREALDRLAQAGFEQRVASNHVPELEQIVIETGARDRFTAVVSSANVGYEKPHEGFYRAVLAGDDAVGVWMIGDNYEADIMGSEALGMRAILVNHHRGVSLESAITQILASDP